MTTAIQFLESRGRKAALEPSNTLRSLGIGHGIDTPQIVVVGDQSTGKSSSLEAITHIKFPVTGNLCTRSITELIFRRTNKYSQERCDISTLHWDDHLADAEQCAYGKHKKMKISGQYELGKVIEEAKTLLGIDDQCGTLGDLLRIEISGPSQINLRILDLPGLFGSTGETQLTRDVNEIVRSYLEDTRSIILAVVSAENDFDLQRVTAITRQVDPLGKRTLGLITKLDTLADGSASERRYLELAQNNHIIYRLGWHVLCNRSLENMHTTDDERDRAEDTFFNQGAWETFPASQKGVSSLRSRLAKILDDRARSQLHYVETKVNERLINNNKEIKKLGPPRRDAAEQRKYLIEASRRFTEIVEGMATGNYYQDELFGDQNDDLDDDSLHLRAAVRMELLKFAIDMREHGRTRRIVDEVTEANDEVMSRKDYLASVRNMMQLMEGRELPGTFNPLVIGRLFREQSTPWRKIATDCAENLLEVATSVLQGVLDSVFPENFTSMKVSQLLVAPKLRQLRQELMEKLDELLRLRDSGYAITYNLHLAESVREKRIERCRERMKRILENMKETCGFEECVDEIVQASEPDVETSVCISAIDWMEAYYKIALDQFVDEFSRLAIENCLVMKLPSLFTAEMVYEVNDQTLDFVAEEGSERITERTRLEEQQRGLEAGLKELRRCLEDTGSSGE